MFSRVLKSKICISWYFFVFGAMMGNWAAIIPFVQDEHGINNGVLGGILISAIAGAIVSLQIGTYLNNFYGSGISLFLGSLTLICSMPVIGVRSHISILVLGIFFLGLGAGWTDVSMNSQAVLVERLTKLPSLGLFHSVYAIGGLSGAIAGGVLMEKFHVFKEIVIFCMLVIIPEIVCSLGLFYFDEEKGINEEYINQSLDKSLVTNPLINNDNEDGNSIENGAAQTHTHENADQSENNESTTEEEKKKGDIDYRTLSKLSMLCFISYITEGAVGDWSAIYLSDVLKASPFEGALGFVGFQLFVAIGRVYGDRLVLFTGRKVLLQLSGIISTIGLLMVALSKFISDETTALVVCILGFSVCGGGMSVVTPSVISLSSLGVRGMGSTETIAYVSSVGYSGLMVGPPLFGGISVLFQGLEWSFLLGAGITVFITIIAFFVVDEVVYQRVASSDNHSEQLHKN